MMSIAPPTRLAAQRLRQITLGSIVVLVLVTIAAAGLLLGGRGQDGGIVQIESTGLPPVPAAFVQVTTGLLLVLALAKLAGMLRKVAEGQAFETGAGLRGFAFYLFLSVLASILLPPLMEIATAVFGAGDRQVTFAIGGEDVLMLFVTGLLFLVARLLDEAQRVADDASQIV